jgi:hypothetical protein
VRRGLPALVVLLAGCGGERAAMPPACGEGPDAILRALAGAPGPVRLADGSPISRCAQRAFTDGEIQILGHAITPAADRLALRRTRPAAARLGYLLGAVRRGAARGNGVNAELVRKLEGIAGTVEPTPLQTVIRRGERAGERTG